MAELRIKVGAYLDDSLDRILRTVETSSTRASRRVGDESVRSGRARVKTEQDVAKAAEKAARDSEKAATRAAKEQAKEEAAAAKERVKAQSEASKAIMKEWEEEAKAAARKRRTEMAAIKSFSKESQQEAAAAMGAFAASGRAFERDMDRAKAADAKQARNGRRALVASVGRGVGTGLDIAASAAGYALSGVKDLARGAGVDFSLSSQVSKNVSLESAAVNLSNSGYMAGESGPNGRRVDPAALRAQAMGVGAATGTDPGKVIEGLQKFVGLSGDLDTGRQVIGDIAMLSKATGTELDDAAAAAGNLVMQLGDIPNKGEVINQIMRSIAGQGKLGAVEISDMASQMAKVASAAGRLEGNTADNIVLMGAFAQEARQRGGAASATQAATSVQGLINTFTTPARIAKFEEITKKKVTNKEGFVRNPQELLIEALHATKGDPEQFKKIFANVAGARAVEGFATVYRQAGRGDAGEAAVKAEFDRLKKSAMAQGEVADSFAVAMKTTETEATQFNIALQQITSEVQASFLPVLKELSPAVLAIISMAKPALKFALEGDDAKAEAGSKRRAAGDILVANASSEQGYLNRAALDHGNIEESKIEQSEEDIAALNKQIDEQAKAVKASMKYDEDFLGLKAGNRSPKTEAEATHLRELIETRDELSRTVDVIKGELKDGFRELRDGVLTVRLADQPWTGMVPPPLTPYGTTPANAPRGPLR